MPKAVTSKSNPRRNAKLRKLAVNLRHGRKRWDTLQKDWTANTMRMARWMGEARKEFASNNAFSVWLRDNKIGYSNDERMALIEFSNRDSEEIRKFLESAKSRSLRRLLDNLRSDERSPSSYATKTFHLHHPPVQTTDLPPYRLE